MTVTQAECGKCHGTRHIVKHGRYVRCECVRRLVVEIACARAGVPRSYWGARPVDLLSMSRWPSPIPAKVTSPLIMWVVGGAVAPTREMTWAYPLLLAVHRKLPAAAIRLAGLIDAKFDKDLRDAARRDIRDSWALAVDLDTADHKFAPGELTEVWSVRLHMPAVTVFHSAGNIGEMVGRYGSEMARVFAKHKSIIRVGSGRNP